jgi:ectoine hydroxylase-related dioxygenase (phytanoyl-CoA dioxygenase family)
VIRRLGKNLGLFVGEPPDAAVALERDGYVVLPEVFSPSEVAALAAEIEAVFDDVPVDPRPREDRAEFRYEMLNRSALAQAAVGHAAILAAIEPLLGEDCHVIANTAWRNPPEFGGGPWHCDAGPHVPRPSGVPWDDRIPYPVFAVGAHLYLWDCPAECGPTAVVPGSHRSGRLPPRARLFDPGLEHDGRPAVLLPARAGDVALFVSDVWHRGTPAGPGGTGRFFLQCHYGRRDIAQRLRTTADCHQLSAEAVARAATGRERALIGLHDPYFYDG